jgi:hypothetical protein
MLLMECSEKHIHAGRQKESTMSKMSKAALEKLETLKAEAAREDALAIIIAAKAEMDALKAPKKEKVVPEIIKTMALLPYKPFIRFAKTPKALLDTKANRFYSMKDGENYVITEVTQTLWIDAATGELHIMDLPFKDFNGFNPFQCNIDALLNQMHKDYPFEWVDKTKVYASLTPEQMTLQLRRLETLKGPYNFQLVKKDSKTFLQPVRPPKEDRRDYFETEDADMEALRTKFNDRD